MTKSLEWTHHARAKMRQYGLSEARVKRVINSPRRIEEGIAEDTIAMMQPASYTAPRKEVFKRGSKFGAAKLSSPPSFRKGGAQGGKEQTTTSEHWSQEIWVMIAKDKKNKRIISAWRYPGMTKPGEPLPAEIVRELRSGIS